MAIKFQCPGCSVGDVAGDAMAGQKVTCAGCGQTIRLPEPRRPRRPRATRSASDASAAASP